MPVDQSSQLERDIDAFYKKHRELTEDPEIKKALKDYARMRASLESDIPTPKPEDYLPAFHAAFKILRANKSQITMSVLLTRTILVLEDTAQELNSKTPGGYSRTAIGHTATAWSISDTANTVFDNIPDSLDGQYKGGLRDRTPPHPQEVTDIRQVIAHYHSFRLMNAPIGNR